MNKKILVINKRFLASGAQQSLGQNYNGKTDDFQVWDISINDNVTLEQTRIGATIFDAIVICRDINQTDTEYLALKQKVIAFNTENRPIIEMPATARPNPRDQDSYQSAEKNWHQAVKTSVKEAICEVQSREMFARKPTNKSKSRIIEEGDGQGYSMSIETPPAASTHKPMNASKNAYDFSEALASLAAKASYLWQSFKTWASATFFSAPVTTPPATSSYRAMATDEPVASAVPVATAVPVARINTAASSHDVPTPGQSGDMNISRRQIMVEALR